MTNQTQTPKQKAIALLQEIIDAGQDTPNQLGMCDWVCNTSCCLIGDVAVKRLGVDEIRDIEDSNDKYNEVNSACHDISIVLRTLLDHIIPAGDDLGRSIYDFEAYERVEALAATEHYDHLKDHPHLTTDHTSRDIAHDYIRKVIKIVENTDD